jgi:hypothetical protein
MQKEEDDLRERTKEFALRVIRSGMRRADRDFRGDHQSSKSQITFAFCLFPAIFLVLRDAPLAQLAEQVTLNHWVVGSIPTRCRLNTNDLQLI